MNMNGYQQQALTTAIYPDEYKVVYPTLGLMGEAGEVSDKVKKSIRGDTELDKGEVAKELGDVLWYAATLANDLGYTLTEVAQMNLDKLASRKERGVISGNGDNR